MRPRITIFIPTYNGSAYIESTLKSILNQSFQDFEVVCVDDCSTDDTYNIIKIISEIDNRVSLYKTKNNLGNVPRVINFGKQWISGDYFVYSSQDDLFSADWLEQMYKTATETGADSIIPSVCLYYGESSKKNRFIFRANDYEKRIISNREAVSLSLDWSIPGNALWNSYLIKKFGFFDYGTNADEFTVRHYFFHCNKIAFSSGIFYYRRNNQESITIKTSIKLIDFPLTDLKLWAFLKKNNFPKKDQQMILARSVIDLAYFQAKTYFNQILKNQGASKKIKQIWSLYSEYEADKELPLPIIFNKSNTKIVLASLALKNKLLFNGIGLSYLLFDYLRGFRFLK